MPIFKKTKRLNFYKSYGVGEGNGLEVGEGEGLGLGEEVGDGLGLGEETGVGVGLGDIFGFGLKVGWGGIDISGFFDGLAEGDAEESTKGDKTSSFFLSPGPLKPI